MRKLRFKTRYYNLYSPMLFKMRKAYALILSKAWKLDSANTAFLVRYVWDRFLAKKFLQETSYLSAKKINFSDINRTSDSIFILGCGQSINDLTDQEWNIISAHDSIGVNYFYAHPFKPTFHLIELGKSEKSLSCVNEYLLKRPDRKNEKVFLQIRHILTREKITLRNDHKNLHFYSPSVPKSTSIPFMRKVVKRWYSRKSEIMHHSSNLDSTVHFCYQAGYKNIFLLGVDLNTNKYFWDVMSSDLPSIRDIKQATNDDYEISSFDKDPNAKHATADKNKTDKCMALTVVEYLTIVNEEVFKPRKIKFATCSPNSLLRESFEFVPVDSISTK